MDFSSLTIHPWVTTALAFLALILFLVVRVVRLIGRKGAFEKTMPVIWAIFPPDSTYRRLWPERWQKFHLNWAMQYRREVYHKLGSDIFAVVCLFQYDKVFFCDPAGVIDMKMKQMESFPRDVEMASKA